MQYKQLSKNSIRNSLCIQNALDIKMKCHIVSVKPLYGWRYVLRLAVKCANI